MHCSSTEEGMTTMQRAPGVDPCRRRRGAAAAGLPRGPRVAPGGEIEEHIASALREDGSQGAAGVRNVLERLGPPEGIAAAAGPPAPARERGRLESAAL